MDRKQVIALLEANRNEKGVQKWEAKGSFPGKLKSYGIGLTVLRKLAKQVGRDHELAVDLWQSDIYDARMIAMLIDEPKKITRAQAEAQVEEVDQGYLAHVFSSCDATLAKVPFVVELAVDWINSEDKMRRKCGYGLLYEISKSKKKSAPDEAFFLERIHHIDNSIDAEDWTLHHVMGIVLLRAGMRSRTLHAAALKVARRIGPIKTGLDEKKHPPYDLEKHLLSDYATRGL